MDSSMGSAYEGFFSSNHHLPPKKRLKFIIKSGEDDEALKSYDFGNEAATSSSKKPIDLCSKEPTKSMDSAFEASPSSNLHLPIKKRLTMNANSVLKEEVASSIEEDDRVVMRMRKGKGLKRTIINTFIDYRENVDDVDDQERVTGECLKTKKKEKKSELTKEQSQLLDQAVERAPSVLPQEFINKINEMGGNEITLVITKYLYKTDLSAQHMRLSMPLKQIKINAGGFLRDKELQELERGTIKVVLLQPSLELKNMLLAKWYTKAKHDGTRNANYILRTNWMDVVKTNDLQKYGIVQVWSFRIQEQLHMALVKLPNVIL